MDAREPQGLRRSRRGGKSAAVGERHRLRSVRGAAEYPRMARRSGIRAQKTSGTQRHLVGAWLRENDTARDRTPAGGVLLPHSRRADYRPPCHPRACDVSWRKAVDDRRDRRRMAAKDSAAGPEVKSGGRTSPWRGVTTLPIMWSHESIRARVQGAAIHVSAESRQRRGCGNYLAWPAGCAVAGAGYSGQTGAGRLGTRAASEADPGHARGPGWQASRIGASNRNWQ